MNIDQATPAQREAITTDHQRVLALAGPGSGKTATTATRIARLIAAGTPASKIAAITFTNAAARELEKRIGLDARLGHAGTLHSFCLRLLREQGGFLGYGGRLAIVSPESATDLLASKAQTLGCKTPIKDLIALKAKGRPERGSRLSLAETVVASYYDDLREAGIVDFDIILTETLALLTTAIGLELPFEYLFVDEVQDSSEVDWAIFDALWIRNKFYVGDPDQAIYSFRGGNVDALLRVAADWRTKVITMEENFRSRAEVCAAANALIENNVGRIAKVTRSVKGPGGTVYPAAEAYNEGDEIGIVARTIHGWLALATPPKEIAVIARTNALAAAFRKTLAATGLPVVAREVSKLPADWSLARAVAELTVNPDNDTLAFFYLVSLYTKRGASPKEAREAAHAARRAASLAGKSINRANIGLHPARTAADVPPLLQSSVVSAESCAAVAELLKELPENASALDLALAMAETREQVKEASPDGIQCLTIHAAKGREFDHVFLVGWEDETIPGRRKCVNEREERRLAYVGLTRARESVSVSWSKSRITSWGEAVNCTPSRFIREAFGRAP